MTRFTQEQKKAALTDLKQGKLSREEVAKKYKMSLSTVNGMLYSQTTRRGFPGMRESGKSFVLVRNLLKRKNVLFQEIKAIESKLADHRKEVDFITKQLEHFEAFYK